MFSFAPVQSVLKALRLLTEVNRCSVATVGELHRRTGMPKPTIVRLLETLIEAGYVTRDERMRGYLVTSQVAHLSSGFHGAPLVIEAARPWATALTRQIKWPCAVCLLDYDAVVVRFSTIPDSPISPFHATLGYRLNLGGRALGRAYLAFCPDEEREVLRAAMRTSTEPENSGLSDEDVEGMIEQARRRGYTERDPAAEPTNSATIAVPIKLGERVLATFGVTFFRAAVPNPEDKARIIHPLKKAAANIEAQLEALSQSMGVAFQGEK
ncbi:IclR family transcriptional regulator, mhp operon transcriptional activator [Bosea sp. CRIB-10]|uniref:DNA-binding transcriptional regulator n=1 Tax=Bosea sp. CRIB-10 TaxID=378404 RepID=UPI0008F26361|nr:DNA-binding transcriptional regulator [Bosea sp. CRIB-10]SFD41338.1 IclR family transcriptional regulator, mhp operon transcriptional activator [Bosea sp. CRIB-10]